MSVEDDRELVKVRVVDLAAEFLYYDRKEDEELPPGRIEELVRRKHLPVATIVLWFENALEAGLP